MIYKNVRKNKKFYIMMAGIYFVLSIITLSFAFSVFVNNSSSEFVDTWQNHAVCGFNQEVELNEEGEEVVYNLIETPEQFAGIFVQNAKVAVSTKKWDSYFTASNNYKLLADIDLSGITWSPSSLDSSITIDGNFHIISNLKISSSSSSVTNIGFVSVNNGTIKNMSFSNVKVECTSSSTSQFNIGTVAGTNNGKIENVNVLSSSATNYYVKGQSITNSGRVVGGIVGVNNGTISHTINYVSLYQGTHMGGIAGVMYGGTIEKCYNYGEIYSSTKDCLRLGGIVGEISSGGTVKLCLNFVNIEDSSTTSNVAIGGIIGINSGRTIEQCGNYGKITAGSDSASISYAGGIVGSSSGTVKNCFSIADITAKAQNKNTSNDTMSCVTYNDAMFSKHVHCPYGWIPISWINDEMYYTRSNPSRSYYKIEAYAGGICGYSSSGIYNCYSVGSTSGGEYRVKITINQSTRIYNSQYSVQVGANTTVNMNFSVQMLISYYGQPIANGGNTVSTCYHSETNKTDYYRNRFYGGGGSYYNDTNNTTYYYDVQYKSYVTGVGIANSNPGVKTKLYSSNGYFYIETVTHDYVNTSGSGDTAKAINSNKIIDGYYINSIRFYGTPSGDIKNTNIGSEWIKGDSTKNGGYPYLKNMYW